MNDEELTARAREVAVQLRRRAGDLDRLAGELLAQMADRLDARPVNHLDAAAAEVRAMLNANTAREVATRNLPEDTEMRQQIRAWPAAGHRPAHRHRRGRGRPWLSRKSAPRGRSSWPGASAAGTAPPRSRVPGATARRARVRGRCPPCDGDLPGEED